MAGGGSHLTAGQVKYGVSQYKPVPAGNPSGYGNYTHPAGYTISSPGVIGAGVGVDDVNRMKYKDNNIYAPTPQVQIVDVESEIYMDLNYFLLVTYSCSRSFCLYLGSSHLV